MKKYLFLAGLLFIMTALTSRAQSYSYNIQTGSLTFTQNGSDLQVIQQGGPTENYVGYYNTSSNILIRGNGTATPNTISIQSATETVITLSNVVIQTSTETPILLTGGGTRILIFLATGTTNQLKTTALPAGDIFHPAIHVRGDITQKVTITGNGSLVAEGGESSAGIGSDYYGNAGEITIGGNATVIATGGMGSAGIGGGEGTAGGITTILSNANVIAKGGAPGVNVYGETLGGGAGIGGGGANYSTAVPGGAGGTITLADSARVTAYAGVGASAIGSGASAVVGGTIEIGISNKVVAVSDGTRSAIDDDDNTLGGNGYVLQANYQSSKNAGVTSSVRRYLTSTTYTNEATITPTNTYKSFACSVSRTNAFRLYANTKRQEHQADLNFTVITTGMTNFTDVTDSGRVVVTLDQNGGSGGTNQVVATYNSAMPSGVPAPTNSNPFLSFGGYFLVDGTTKYYNANMTSARNCDIADDFTLYAKWLDSRIWDGSSRSYTWYTNGTNPYIISTAPELAGLAYLVNGTAPSGRETFSGKRITLLSDLNLSNYTWIAIGNFSQNSANLFQGQFNGGTKIISGLKIATNLNYQSLFGYIGSSAAISNLIVSGSITASNYVGGIVGYNAGGTLLNCGALTIVQGTNYVGGLAGLNSGSIQNSSSAGTVGGSDAVGGIVGGNTGTVQNVRTASTVTSFATDARAGGIAGHNAGQIHNGLMLGSITYGASTKVGRVAGENISTGSVTNGYYLSGGSPTNAIGVAAGVYSSLGSFQNVAGALTATDGTSLGYGTQLHLALNKWVYFNTGSSNLLWWTTSTGAYPDLTTNRPPFTLSTPSAVPFDWLAGHYPLASQSTYESLAVSNGANNIPVWQSYVAGLAPTNAQSLFIASISITNSTPYITWTPNLAERIYTVQGKTNLTTAGWEATNSATRFFKVNVDLP